MCQDHQVFCSCGNRHASFNFRDNIMPEKVIAAVYCPECTADLKFDAKSMITDNGWVIAYDMAVAEYYASSRAGDVTEVTPEILFDDGLATWRGVYPGDHIDSVKERQELAALSKVDMRRYLEEFRNWGTQRMERLRQEGWRKART